MLPLLILPGMMLISFVKPDPKTIGMNLAEYYPGHVQAERGPPAPRPDRPAAHPRCAWEA